MYSIPAHVRDRTVTVVAWTLAVLSWFFPLAVVAGPLFVVLWWVQRGSGRVPLTAVGVFGLAVANFVALTLPTLDIGMSGLLVILLPVLVLATIGGVIRAARNEDKGWLIAIVVTSLVGLGWLVGLIYLATHRKDDHLAR